MEYFINLENKGSFVDKIKINNYTQGESNSVENNILKSKNIYEIILSQFDYNYQILEPQEKKPYVIKKSLEISTFFDLNYDNYNFNSKKFNKNLVSSSLQKMNNLSSILFYNEYYNINIIICNNINKKLQFYNSSCYPKYENLVFINYENNLFNFIEKPESYSFSNIFDMNNSNYVLDSVINYDITDNLIFKSKLKSLSSYKVNDLIELAKEKNINLKNNNKKKTKKELYDELYLLLS